MNQNLMIAHRLRRLREKTGLSQKAFSDMIGLKMRSWQDYEAGNRVPGGLALQALSMHGFCVGWILTGQGEMQETEKFLPDSAPLNEQLLEACIAGIETHLSARKQTLPATKKATLITLLYQEILERNQETPQSNKSESEMLEELIGRFVRLAF